MYKHIESNKYKIPILMSSISIYSTDIQSKGSRVSVPVVSLRRTLNISHGALAGPTMGKQDASTTSYVNGLVRHSHMTDHMTAVYMYFCACIIIIIVIINFITKYLIKDNL